MISNSINIDSQVHGDCPYHQYNHEHRKGRALLATLASQASQRPSCFWARYPGDMMLLKLVNFSWKNARNFDWAMFHSETATNYQRVSDCNVLML